MPIEVLMFFQMPIRVNGECVDQELINQEFSQIKSWHEQRSQVSCCDRDDEFLAQAKANVIGQILLNQKAKMIVDELSESEIDEAMDQLKKDCGGEAAFLAQIGTRHEDMARVREQVIQRSKVEKLIQKVCTPNESHSDQQLQAYYHSHPQSYTSEARVKAMHIYKSFRQSEDKDALFQECCEKREALIGGADFAQIAKSFSDKPAEEVDLGWFKRGELLDEFEFVTFSMQIGEISPVFASYHAFHIAKLTDKEPARLAPFCDVKQKVAEDFCREEQTRILDAYIESLRKNAKVEECPDETNDPQNQ